MTRRALLGSSLAAASLLRAQRYGDLPFRHDQTVGLAEEDVTPDLGMERPGNYVKNYLQRFYDPCKVRAAAFGSGEERVAVVGLDALVVPRSTVLAARRRIEQRCGIPGDRVMVAASHSHSSGPTGMVQPGEYDHASGFVQQLAYEESSAADADYLQLVEDRIVSAVARADAAREPALCGFGFGREEAAAINRRVRMRNGLTYTHPRQGNPDVAGGPGPMDPEVGVIGVWDRHRRLRGALVNYACHATAGPPGVSANWIYWMERVIRGAFGPDVVVVFTAAPSGDVTQVDNFGPYRNRSGSEAQQFVGGRVGAEAVKTLLAVQPGAFSPLHARTKLLQIPRRPPSRETLERAHRIVRDDRVRETDRAEWVFAKETVMLDALLTVAPIAEVEIQAVQVGPALFVSNPAEYFVEYGLRIKEASPFPFTFPVELANGSVGYVPTLESFGEHGGGYETRLTSYSNLEIDAGDRIAEASIELARSLTPGPVPEPPPAPPFSGPWDYGDNPPGLR